MSSLQADKAYEEFDIPETAHISVLENASRGRPWTPEVVSMSGVEIEKDVYAEGVLRTDPREKQDRHDLLIDGRLERYRENIDRGRNKWDLVVTERDFYSHPDTMQVDGELNHDSAPETHLKKGDGDLLFLDLDNYEAQIVEVKPNDSYLEAGTEAVEEEIDMPFWEDYEENSSFHPSQGTSTSTGSTMVKKSANWREAWQSVVDELENKWRVYQPVFIVGSDVLDTGNLDSNSEYALPPSYSQQPGYALGSDEGFRKAESSSDLEVLNEFFFRGGISELVEGERPEVEEEHVF